MRRCIFEPNSHGSFTCRSGASIAKSKTYSRSNATIAKPMMRLSALPNFIVGLAGRERLTMFQMAPSNVGHLHICCCVELFHLISRYSMYTSTITHHLRTAQSRTVPMLPCSGNIVKIQADRSHRCMKVRRWPKMNTNYLSTDVKSGICQGSDNPASSS